MDNTTTKMIDTTPSKHEWYQEAKDNAEAVDFELTNLIYDHLKKSRLDYRGFWNHARQISDMFKTINPLLREDRQQLWDRFNEIRDQVRERGEKERRLCQEHSSKIREKVEKNLEQAQEIILSAEGKEPLRKAKSLIDRTTGILKKEQNATRKGLSADPPVDPIGTIEVRMAREDVELCWRFVRKIRETLKEKRGLILDRNYSELSQEGSQAVENAQEKDPYVALESIKSIQDRLKNSWVTREQREKLRDLLNGAWQIAIQRVEERRGERKRQHEEWLQRMTDHLQRWESLFGKNEQIVADLREQIEKLENDVENSINADFIDRAKNWIGEKKTKILDIERTNRDLERKIKSVKNKIGRAKNSREHDYAYLPSDSSENSSDEQV
ncbi:MAG: hypothetical protein B6244_00615 [Candidatus Cloacimonetes bacterium 4572_55]|nr:MAG: hypothetical protein B6244_00615 [Candidatus Cloacimonetes bacterium 4572_55]